MSTKQDDDAPVTRHDDPRVEVADDPDEIRAQIDDPRADLGDTVEAIAAKTDVKAQVKNTVSEGKARLKDKQDEVTAKLADVRDKAGETPDQARQAVGSIPERIKQPPVPAVSSPASCSAGSSEGGSNLTALSRPGRRPRSPDGHSPHPS